MKYIPQELGSNQCGQACVAMILGLNMEESIKLCGTKGRTTTKILVSALHRGGTITPDKIIRGFPPSGIAILKFTHPDGKSHWVLWKNGKYYDPASGVHRKVPRYLEDSGPSSYLPVLRTEEL